MCGIAGFLSYTTNYNDYSTHYYSLLERMIETMKMRGPNESGIFLSDHVCFAHARLSIIDLKTGQQPMTIRRNDINYHLVYNGELYNMPELRTELQNKGVHFETTSDTEVLLMMYIQYGISFLERLNGIFAFAIYDEGKELVYLARDHFGVKPLYFTKVNSEICFASRIDTIFESGIKKPKLSNSGLNEIFTLGPSKTPGKGVFDGIEEVLPGEVITISKNYLHRTQYYKLVSRIHEDSYEDTIEKVRYLVTDSIQLQMLSDVPIATFLSGGIDSSIVSAICSNKLRQSNKILDTYSFDYKDNSKYFTSNSFQPSLDRPYVDIMINHMKSNHRYLECDYIELAGLLSASVDSRCLPTMADVDSSLLFFCKQVAENHKVVLTGECADEIFGGYPWFYRSDLLESEHFPWINHFDFRMSLLKKDVAESLHMKDYLMEAYYHSIREINVLPEENELETKRRRISYLNIRWFMQTLLDRMDRTSMHNALEARVPFADHRIIDYVFNIPWSMKYRDNTEKHLLRTACVGLLPENILFRKKSPYPKTYDPAYEATLAHELEKIIGDTSQPLNRYVDSSSVLQFLSSTKDYGKPWFGQLMAGPQMIAYLIQINYWLLKYNL